MVKAYKLTDEGNCLIMSGEDMDKCKIENNAESIKNFYKDTYSPRVKIPGGNLIRSLSKKIIDKGKSFKASKDVAPASLLSSQAPPSLPSEGY